MNQPAGYVLDAAGKVVSVNPWGVIFNRATSYETVHMILAAYMVGGFMIASVYAVALLRGRTGRHHQLGFVIPFTVAALASPAQIVVGDWAARSISHDQPVKFAAMELVPTTSSRVPESVFGYLDASGRPSHAIEIPGMVSLLTGFSTDTTIPGLDSTAANRRPSIAEVNFVHLSWDAMVGLGVALVGLSAWYAAAWLRRRTLPRSRWFLRCAAVSGVAAVIALEAGWMITEVGRQPWIVQDVMRVGEGATGVAGVGITFLVVLLVYTAVAMATVLVLRAMSRRWQTEDVDDDSEVPYGPPPSRVAAVDDGTTAA
jgi:cytochrome d ubiquinol oxidase subunit I